MYFHSQKQKNELLQMILLPAVVISVIRKKRLVKTVIRKKNIRERMFKTMKKIKCSPRGERGAIAKAKPQKLLVS